MKQRLSILLFLTVLPVLFPSWAGAADSCPFSISIAGQYIPFVSGKAGTGDGSPDYNDAFDDGLAVSLEGNYKLNDSITLVAGVAVEHHSGNAFKEIDFDDLDIVPVYLGLKFHLPIQGKAWAPYLRTDIGLAHYDAVDISYSGINARYWDSSWELMFDLGAGIEYRINTLGLFAELRARYLENPSSALDDFSRSDESWTLPLIIGVTVHF